MDIHELITKKFNIVDGNGLPFRSCGGTREILAAFMNEMGYRSGAEIGVRRGDYSERLCRNMRGVKLKCIDPWIGFRRNSIERMNKYYAFACRALSPYGVEIIRKTSMEAVKDVPDGSLDFVYIDAMHEFDFVMMDIISWTPKVRKGGIVSGHDYTAKSVFCGVIEAVKAYTDSHDIKRWYITDAAADHPQVPSWFWVK